jgi:ligand-binding sensor domain-containing protein
LSSCIRGRGNLPECPVYAQFNGFPAPELITDRQGLPQAFVPSIVQDKRGFIWMATRDGLARYDGNQFKVFQPDPNGGPSLSFAGIAQLKIDSHGKIWIMSEHGDLDVFDPVTEQFTNFSHNPAFRKLLGNHAIRRFCIDQQDQLWIVRSDLYLASFNLHTNQSKLFRHNPKDSRTITSNVIWDVDFAPDGKIWLLTKKGIDYYSKRTQTFVHYQYQSGQPNSLPEIDLKGLYIRPNGEVVVVTFNHHLAVLQPATGKLRTYPLPPPPHPLSFAHITADRQGVIYFARHDQIFKFTDDQGPVMLKAGDPKDPVTYLNAFIDQSDVLWLGTGGSGVRKYDLRIKPFQTSRYQSGFVADLINNGWLNLSPNETIPINPALSSYDFRYTFDSQSRMWYNSGSSDLYRIDFKAKKPIKYLPRFPPGIS